MTDTFYKLRSDLNARAYTPSDGDAGDFHGRLAEQSMGDWSWKPDRYDADGMYRLFVAGARCTCTLAQPVGTACARHN